MKNLKSKKMVLTATLLPLALAIPVGAYFMYRDQASVTATPKTHSADVERHKTMPVMQTAVSHSTLNPQALKQGLKAYHWAVENGKVHNQKVLTIVDFTKASNEKRLWVINPKSGEVLMNIYTAQGKNSGLKYATHFSNKVNSDASSLGAYVTAVVYNGEHGESMRLQGLEKGINNNAMRRDVVIHSARYVTPSFIKAADRAGRSWGCFAVNPAKSKELIHLTRGGSVLFAYAPAENHDPNFG